MKTETMSASNPNAIAHAVDVLTHGGLVAFPTDTVYGLASLPFKSEYVEGLFSAKGRTSSRAIAILVGDYPDLNRIVQYFDERSLKLARRYWPGPLTLVVPKLPGLPAELSQDDTIGVRMPDHPVALALLRKIGPLAVSSANLSGQPSTNTAQEVNAQLDGRVHLVLDGGRSAGGVPSTVVNCISTSPVILREGPISLQAIQSALE